MSIQTTSELSSIDIVQEVAKQTGRDPVELPPLYDYIDPNVLDSLFTGSQSG
ncbi:HalOD1 output domain-containing protein [Natrinema sp. CBA1119]|uniref:HalOD1 output domain-containing protein n=1 Tax=Natrinema sp. CBA1119 TaxID=1608465 RepID=UPI00159BD984|nr:HalOD1 output domain-containing protein [Natrinema sp. CBA1119]